MEKWKHNYNGCFKTSMAQYCLSNTALHISFYSTAVRLPKIPYGRGWQLVANWPTAILFDPPVHF